jgi:methyl coenzyme M reductase subunit D
METDTNKLLKTNRNKLMKTNKPYNRNHTRKDRTTCNEVKFGNDANNVDAELRATCEA